jgi:hypothetical protein
MTTKSNKPQWETRIMNISKHHSRYNFSRLHADIVEEDGAFTVRVRMLNHLQKKNHGAWGEEIAPTFELATAMIDGLARQFSIPQNCIFIKIIMTRFKDGTMH